MKLCLAAGDWADVRAFYPEPCACTWAATANKGPGGGPSATVARTVTLRWATVAPLRGPIRSPPMQSGTASRATVKARLSPSRNDQRAQSEATRSPAGLCGTVWHQCGVREANTRERRGRPVRNTLPPPMRDRRTRCHRHPPYRGVCPRHRWETVQPSAKGTAAPRWCGCAGAPHRGAPWAPAGAHRRAPRWRPLPEYRGMHTSMLARPRSPLWWGALPPWSARACYRGGATSHRASA